jgi:ubiquinone/menaquinone biosynthesis C-methylase UbiE
LHDQTYARIAHLLACPDCRSDLELSSSGADCTACGKHYNLKEGILSFLPQEDSYWQRYFTEKKKSETDEARQVAYSYKRNFLLTQCAVIKMLGNIQGMNVLEVGCGHGLMNAWIHRENTLVGADFTFEFLTDARRRGVIPLHADAHTLPLKEGTFDLVLSIEVIQHFPKSVQFIEDLCRFVRRGGVLLVSGHSVHSFPRYLSRYIQALLKFGFPQKPSLFLHDERQIISHLKGLGFETELLYTRFPFSHNLMGKADDQWRYKWVSNFFIKAHKKP